MAINQATDGNDTFGFDGTYSAAIDGGLGYDDITVVGTFNSYNFAGPLPGANFGFFTSPTYALYSKFEPQGNGNLYFTNIEKLRFDDALVYLASNLTVIKRINGFNADGSDHVLQVEYVQTGITGKPYDTQDAIYDPSGKLISLTRTYAGTANLQLEQIVHPDGSQTVTNRAPDGSRQVTNFAVGGQLASSFDYTARGVLTHAAQRPGDGTQTYQTYDPLTGLETGYGSTNADGTRTYADLAVVGKPYAEQVATYDASGNVVKMTRTYGDAAHTLAFSQVLNPNGSTSIDQYDTSGREIVKIESNPYGPRDVYLYTYAGASTTPASVEYDHYLGATYKTYTDTTYANGSHTQRAFVADVTLTSNTGVSDTFTSSSRGIDTFVFKAGFGQDLITNFHVGPYLSKDTIQFDSSIVPNYLDLQNMITASGHDTLITVSPTDSILIKGVAPTAILPENFSFVSHHSQHV